MKWRQQGAGGPAEILRRACGNLADADMVPVPRWAAMAGALALEDHEHCDTELSDAVDKAVKEADDGWGEERDAADHRHQEEVDELRDRIAELEAELSVLA